MYNLNHEQIYWEDKHKKQDYFGCDGRVDEVLKERYFSNDLENRLNAICMTKEMKDNFVNIFSNMLVLEIGCGHGGFGARIASAFKDYFGVDISKTVIDVGNEAIKNVEILNMKLYHCSGEDISILYEYKFDIIFSTALFIHIPLELAKKYLIETSKLLKDDGYFIHHTNMIKGNIGLHVEYVQNYTEEEYNNLYENTGLKILHKHNNNEYSKGKYLRYTIGQKR